MTCFPGTPSRSIKQVNFRELRNQEKLIFDMPQNAISILMQQESLTAQESFARLAKMHTKAKTGTER